MPVLELASDTARGHKLRYRVDGDCWIFEGAVSGGYGMVCVGGRAGGCLPVHRFVYMKLVGAVEPKEDVHHTCERPLCIRPDHLEKMTETEHGRFHGKMSKAGAIEAVRTLYLQGWSPTDIGRAFGIDRGSVWRIGTGRSYGEVAR